MTRSRPIWPERDDDTMLSCMSTSSNHEDYFPPINPRRNNDLSLAHSETSTTSLVKPAEATPIQTALAICGYTLKREIGRGSFAIVSLAYSTKHNRNVAVRDIRKTAAERRNPGYLQKFLAKEVEVIKQLKHHSLACFLELIETSNHLYVVMEVAENGCVLTCLQSNEISESQAGAWFHQILDALEYIHQMGVAHRDLKLDNLLLDARNHIRVTDFGFARSGITKTTFSETYVGSYVYCSMEILQGIPYQPFLADMWSAGVILFAFLCKLLPFSDDNFPKLIHQIRRLQAGHPLHFPRHRTPAIDAQTLLQQKLLVCQEDRQWVKEVRQDDWCLRMACYRLEDEDEEEDDNEEE